MHPLNEWLAIGHWRERWSRRCIIIDYESENPKKRRDDNNFDYLQEEREREREAVKDVHHDDKRRRGDMRVSLSGLFTHSSPSDPVSQVSLSEEGGQSY